MKMADKTFGNIGMYQTSGEGFPRLALWERMRLGCDVGRHLFTTKNYTFMMDYGKFTNTVDYLFALTYGNIRYIWYRLTRRGF